MEDDLIIHDPAFFDKLNWFQQNFGYTSLLMPVRCEVPATGTPAKVIVDFDMEEWGYKAFRRPGQRDEIEGVWNGQRQLFSLPKNPHAGSFFLTAEQMDYWTKQPTYGDHDASWMGPIESAGTLSVGRVFDLYKPLRPDPFFLELQHFGVRYASRLPPEGRRYGDPPLLAIAQNAIRAALDPGQLPDAGDDGNRAVGPSFPRLFRHWIAQGSAVELRGQMDTLESTVKRQTGELEARDILANEAQRQRAGLMQHIEELQLLNERFAQHNEDLERHCEGLARHDEDLKRHCEGLAQHNDDLTRHCEGLAQHNDDLTRHCEGLAQHNDDLTRHCEGLTQHNEDLTRHCEGLAQHHEDLKRQCEMLTQRNEDLKQQCEGLTLHNNDLASTISSLQEITREWNLRSHSLRWLLGALRTELLRPWRGRPLQGQ
jgi:archaellum component FlaC